MVLIQLFPKINNNFNINKTSKDNENPAKPKKY
jgi:hypothetical protein